MYRGLLILFCLAGLHGGVQAATDPQQLLEEIAYSYNPLDQVSPGMAQSQDGSGDPDSDDCRDWGRDDPRGFCFDAHFLTRNFKGVVTDRSGTLIDMTVYVPSREKRLKHAPLIIHSHGFGGAKAANLNLPGSIAAEHAARKMWQERGYFVISFSERGFGKSTDLIGMMQPELEGLDANEVIDWAIKHLREGIYDFQFDAGNPEHVSAYMEYDCPLPGRGRGRGEGLIEPASCPPRSLLRSDKGGPLNENRPDPAVGMLGYSYGGGFQYTATHAAQRFLPYQRIDAISPQGTWFDLRYSLAQHDVPKTGWINILTAFAAEGSTAVGLEDGQVRPVPPLILQARAESDVLNRVTAQTSETFLRHSPVNYCDPQQGSSTRDVDVFHVQGLQDTLFNFNDGYNNVICAERGGNDARLLMVTGGHVLPAISPANHSGNTGMSIDEVVWCTADTSPDAGLSVADMTVAWYREKLEGVAGAANMIPKACIVQENLDRADKRLDPATGRLSHPDFHPQSGFEPAIPNYNKHRFAGEGVTYRKLSDIPVGCAAGGPGCMLKGTARLAFGPAGSSEFVPLLTVGERAQVIAGIPTLQLKLNVPHPDPVLFVGIGVRRGAQAPLDPVADRSGGVTSSVVGEFLANDVDRCQAQGACFEGFRDQDSEGYRDQLAGQGSGQRGSNDVELLHAQLLAIRSTRYPFEARSGPMESGVESAVIGSLTTGEQIQNNRRGPLWFGCPPNESGCEFGRMVGISSRLNPGDEVGLYFFGSHLQYATNSGRIPGPVDAEFTVNLPITDR